MKLKTSRSMMVSKLQRNHSQNVLQIWAHPFNSIPLK